MTKEEALEIARQQLEYYANWGNGPWVATPLVKNGGKTKMDGNELFKILESHYMDNYALAEEMTKDIAEKTNEPLAVVEKAIYRTSTTTGNSALAIAAIVAEYHQMVKDIHIDARNTQEASEVLA